MNRYSNLTRPGLRTSTSADPKILMEDINRDIKELNPAAVPLLSLYNSYFGKGAKPVSHKIQVMAKHNFNHFDYCSANILGVDLDPTLSRFALLVLDQPSRPELQDRMYYYPQDKFYIVSTGQTVIVTTTPDAAIKYNGTDELELDITLTGNTRTRTLQGTIVVRNIEPLPIRRFTTSDMVYLGRTIYESQNIEAQPYQTDYIFDCNFVEHKEAVVNMTEDQKNMVKTLVKPDWTIQQEENFNIFKLDIEYSAWFGEREVDMSVRGRPMRHMRGLMNSIKTNVGYYNPETITDFEEMYANFLFEQAFRYNSGSNKSKLGFAGGRFLFNFNMAFREYRRTSEISDIGKKIGLNADTYMIPGGFYVTMMRSEAFYQGTKMENWNAIVDPSLCEWRVVKDFNSRFYENNDERLYKLMIEWQGSIAWHLEQHHALLRTA